MQIRHLLSQITAENETNVKETIENMLKEISKSMSKCGYSQEEIQSNLCEIMTISEDHEEHSMESHDEKAIESLSDYIYRYSSKFFLKIFLIEFKSFNTKMSKISLQIQ